MSYDGPALIIELSTCQPFYLRPGQSLSLGRSSKNDIVVKDPSVSRFHASITWEDKFPRIADNKSTAGVLVDGNYVGFRHLSGLHSIVLGNTKIRVEMVKTERECPTEVTNRVLPEQCSALLSALDESDDVTLYNETGSRDIIGYLSDNKAIQDLLINLEDHKRTGTLTVSEGTLTGTVIYGLGKIKGAKCANRTGYAALEAICSFSRGSYHFSVSVDVGEYGLNVSPLFYLRKFSKRLTKRRPRLKYK